MIKKTLTAFAITTALVASPVSAATHKTNLEKFNAEKAADDAFGSFPWIAVGVLAVGISAGIIASLACCD